jgi:quercetin dioxygenase-like cupin family protein
MPQNKLEKIWGFRERLLETTTVVVDRLTLEKNSFCSWHYHEFKYNMFIVLEGELCLELEGEERKWMIKDEHYIVDPKIKHRFITEEVPAKIMEVMYTKPVLEDDIIRSIQGGKIIDNVYITEDELKKRE